MMAVVYVGESVVVINDIIHLRPVSSCSRFMEDRRKGLDYVNVPITKTDVEQLCPECLRKRAQDSPTPMDYQRAEDGVEVVWPIEGEEQ